MFNIQGQGPSELTHGMYIPLSYARVLLNDDCTLGSRGGRIFSYERVNRYLVGSEFAELVKHGLVGTVGTSVEELRNFGLQCAREGYSIVLGSETSKETPRAQATRARSRSTKKRPKVNFSSPPASQPPLFDVPGP
ncbi:hypothetical protein [Streptomyces sp. NPDC005953]|uniref:hypothetical protein n=1 Tax=Streptomyces sp. NPDC005953 TaxID=3156719 RepID=UPI0033DD8CD3